MSAGDDAIRVLYVDGDRDFAHAVAERIERDAGSITVARVTGAAEALDELSADGFECVVSRHDLPDSTGVEFLRDVRDRFGSIPFVLFTDTDAAAIEEAGLSTEATGVVHKTGDPEQYDRLADRILEAVSGEISPPPADAIGLLETIVDHATDAIVTIDETSPSTRPARSGSPARPHSRSSGIRATNWSASR